MKNSFLRFWNRLSQLTTEFNFWFYTHLVAALLLGLALHAIFY